MPHLALQRFVCPSKHVMKLNYKETLAQVISYEFSNFFRTRFHRVPVNDCSLTVVLITRINSCKPDGSHKSRKNCSEK